MAIATRATHQLFRTVESAECGVRKAVLGAVLNQLGCRDGCCPYAI